MPTFIKGSLALLLTASALASAPAAAQMTDPIDTDTHRTLAEELDVEEAQIRRRLGEDV